MQRRPLGRSGTTLARIGQGTWRLRDPAAAGRALLAGLALGMDHLDTAELYEARDGAERVVGQVLAKAPGRPFVATKVRPHVADRIGVRASLEASLARLGCEAVDLVYHHWPSDTGNERALRALADCVDAGLARFAGVSNYDVADLEEARSILGSRLVANQILYHLRDRGAESAVLPWCKAHGVTVVAYSPFGQESWVPPGQALETLQAVAGAHGASARAIALAFLTRDQEVVAIPKAERVEHVQDNARGDLTLTRGEAEAVAAAFPVRPGLRTV